MRVRDRDSELIASLNFSPPLPLHMFLCHLPVAIAFFFGKAMSESHTLSWLICIWRIYHGNRCIDGKEEERGRERGKKRMREEQARWK